MDDCRIFEEQVQDLLDGILDDAETDQLMSHIQDCDLCRSMYAELARVAYFLDAHLADGSASTRVEDITLERAPLDSRPRELVDLDFTPQSVSRSPWRMIAAVLIAGIASSFLWIYFNDKDVASQQAIMDETRVRQRIIVRDFNRFVAEYNTSKQALKGTCEVVAITVGKALPDAEVAEKVLANPDPGSIRHDIFIIRQNISKYLKG